MARKDFSSVHRQLDAFVNELKPIYGDALKSVILFGSYARGDYREGSDVDVLLLLDMTDEEIRQKDDALSELTFEYEVERDIEIEPMVLSMADYRKWKNVHEFLLNVQKDGVKLRTSYV